MIAALLVAALLGGDIASLYREAREAERRRDFQSALAKYEAVLALDPAIAEAWANKGLVLYELGRHREALSAFDRAAGLKPELVTAHLFAGLEHLRFGEPRKAIGPLGTALKLDPGNVPARYALANAHAELGGFEQAIALYREVLERSPGMDRVRYALAIAYLNFSNAIARKLVDSHSGYGKLLLAEYLALREQDEPAEANYRAAVEALPESVEAREALRRFYLGRNQAEKARALGAPLPEPASDSLAAAIQLWRAGRHEAALPTFLRNSSDRARYWQSLTCRALAQRWLLESVRRNPDSFEAHLLLADLAKDTADEATAETEYEQAARLAPDNPEAQLLLIRFVAPRDPAAALEFARRAAARLPRHPDLNVELGKLLLKQGSAQDAAAHFRRALEGEPGLAAARAGLAEAHAARGERAQAIAEMARAVSADPDGSWHYRLATWYKEAGRAEEARAAFAETARIKAAARARQEAEFLERTRAQAVP